MFQTNLIDQCKKRNRKAQLQLYNKYCNGMFIVARRFMKSDEDAEDAMQDAFIKAFQKLNQFKGEVTFGAWLKRIVVHTCIDKLKLQKMEFLPLEESYMNVVDGEDDSWLVADHISLEQVKTCIDVLPDKYRFVVMLYLMEGYDHQEISGILGISQVASRSQLMRGKKKLKELLKTEKNGTRS